MPPEAHLAPQGVRTGSARDRSLRQGELAALGAHSFKVSEHPEPIDDKFDVSWADKVQGKFRAVFDSPEISEGAALFRAMIWCDEYKSVYGTARSEMSPVLVVRHKL